MTENLMHHSDRYFIEKAIELARQNIASNHGGPFGAVIVKNGKIVGEGSNSVTATNDPTAHAEVNAIRVACKKLDTFQLVGCVIYTSCEPCPMCLGAIYWARIEKYFLLAIKKMQPVWVLMMILSIKNLR